MLLFHTLYPTSNVITRDQTRNTRIENTLHDPKSRVKTPFGQHKNHVYAIAFSHPTSQDNASAISDLRQAIDLMFPRLRYNWFVGHIQLVSIYQDHVRTTFRLNLDNF